MKIFIYALMATVLRLIAGIFIEFTPGEGLHLYLTLFITFMLVDKEGE